MKILACVDYNYYEINEASYEYISFVDCLRNMGHIVHHFDYRRNAVINPEAMNDFFLSIVKEGAYDLILIVMYRDQFFPESIDAARQYSLVIAWNCDDDWRWENYSSTWAEHFTYMITTYRHIYEANKKEYPNLLLNQWGCTGLYDGINSKKNIPMSFVGGCYGRRYHQIERLRKEVGLQAFGRGVIDNIAWKPFDLKTISIKTRRRIARMIRIPFQEPDLSLRSQDAVKEVWNRSHLSFTPLEASTGGGLQVKARVFDQGLSGTLMLCNRNEAIHEFYQPGKEYVEYEDMDDCIEKAKYYLKHESERCRIAEAYYKRTKSEHLWSHRFNDIFNDIGIN